MNEVVIRIIDSTNNVLGDLDLKNFNDFPLVITKGIVNLDNLKARTGTYTKTFKVPNTKNNSKLLSNVDDINSRKDYRDALGRKPCVIMVNGSEVERGFVQVSKVYEGFELDSFELVFFGNNIDWVKGAAEKKLNSITTYANNAQVYNVSGINTANSNSVDTGYDHCYPYISRGGNKADNDTEVRDYFPCFYLKSLLNQGLNDLGWNVNSSFLDNANIKALACDLNSDMKVAQSVIDDSKTRASITSDITSTEGILTPIVFDDDSTVPNEDNGNYDNTTGIYTVPTTGRYNFTVSLNTGNWTLLGGIQNQFIEINVADTNFFEKVSDVKEVSTNGQQTTTYELSTVLQAGETIRIYYKWNQVLNEGFDIISGTYFKVQRSAELVEGDSFNLNETIPDDIKLLDIVNDFTRMFNVYYWSDVKTRTIYFEPRDNFFKATTTALDWSEKLDINKKYEIDYVSSYKRNVSFSYRDLDSDEWLKGWQKTNKRTYGKYNHVLPNRFGEGTTEIKLDLFCASYAHIATEATPIEGSSFNSNKAFTTLKYWNEYLTNRDIPTERIDGYNPRIFFFKNGFQNSLDGTSRRFSLEGTLSSTIPYGIFEEYNNTKAPNLIVQPQNLSFTGDDGLFANYYSNMLKNIEEGGRLIAYFNLNSTDFNNLDFRNLVYIDSPAQAKGYYLIESVIDYNPISNGLTKVSLFKFENLGSVPIDTTQEGNNEDGVDQGNSDDLEPVYVEDGDFLIEVWHEDAVSSSYKQVFK